MAGLTSAAVALYPTIANGGLTLAEIQFGFPANSLLTRSLKLTLTGQGGQTDTITATALGFSKLVSCSNLFDDENNKIFPAVIDPVTNTLNLAILTDATDASRATPANVSSTGGYITVTGFPFVAATAPVT